MFPVELDEIDYRLLLSLKADSRLPLKTLARQANVSVPTARARIRRLSSMGVIRFTTILDVRKVMGGIVAFINIKARVPDLKPVAEALSRLDEVDEVHLTVGENDLMAKVQTPDMHSLDEFLIQKLGQIHGIESVRSSIAMETVKEEHGFMIRPGAGLKLYCKVCKKLIMGEMVKKNIDGFEYFFCCNSCASLFMKERGEEGGR